ncbi:MAG: lysophospholipid acyltransferase family protein [Acidobacteriota bacterium]
MALATIVAFGLIAFWIAFGRQSKAYNAVRWWCRVLHVISMTRYEVQGLENVPKGPYLIISNHSSHLDGPGLIVTLPDPVYFVIKKGLAQIPVWGWAATRIGFISIDRSRSKAAQETLHRAVSTIREGRHILVFAEGTRSPDHRLHPFKKGGFHMAIEAGVPVLPVAINGSRRLLPKGAPSSKPGTVSVVVGAPIPTEGLRREDLSDLMARTREAIVAGRRLDPDFVD